MLPQLVNTGEIAPSFFDPTKEYTAHNQEISYTDEQHAVWASLFAGIHQPHLFHYLCREYKRGFELINFEARRIPSVAHLNRMIQPRTGWTIERTAVRYTDADDWYEKFAQRIFLITDYLRSWDQMTFTPEPDMFHDIFGHLPYLTQQFYADIEDKFAPAYKKATQAERHIIKRLAWYSTEFGLVMENNEIKVFGAGLISGKGELTAVIAEIERLNHALFSPAQNIYDQLCHTFYANEAKVNELITEINQLHQKGQMSSEEEGWTVVNQIYNKLGIPRTGYFGGNVLIAPFDLQIIAKIPKTVYAMNPIFFVSKSFTEMDQQLDNFLKPIADR